MAIVGMASLFVALNPGAARAGDLRQCPDKETAVTLDATEPPNLGQLKRRLFQYRCFHYDAEVVSVLKDARDYVESRAAQVAKPALILDIDETSLSNLPEVEHNDYGNIAVDPCDLDLAAACRRTSVGRSSRYSGATAQSWRWFLQCCRRKQTAPAGMVSGPASLV